MADLSKGRATPARKRQKTALATLSVLEFVAENGWFPWQDNEAPMQNIDYSNLRLVCRDVKKLMDHPKCGGPDFEAIVDFLDQQNGFDDDEGFCHHCFAAEGEDCDTCEGYKCEWCTCKKIHRYGPLLLKLDPRLNPNVKFQSLPLRERAKKLLRFLRTVTSNFFTKYYEKCGEGAEPDLTTFDRDRMYGRGKLFISDLEVYNSPIYHFIRHLLFTGWASGDTCISPGLCSPYRGRLLGDQQEYNDWSGRYFDLFHEMFECFMTLHKDPTETKSVPPQSMLRSYDSPLYTLSQVQYIPATIQRCVRNTIDHEAEAMLGKSIADSIDLFRLVRETYDARKDELSQIAWMPCLGVEEENFVPLVDFEKYNPQHEQENIGATTLLWEKKSE